MLGRWKTKKDKKNLRFSSPTIWKEPDNQENCYFCLNNTSGFNSKNKQRFIYKTVDSVQAPVLIECDESESDIELTENIENPDESELSNDENGSSESECYQPEKESAVPSLIS